MSTPAGDREDAMERSQAAAVGRYMELLEKVLAREHPELPQIVTSAYTDRDKVSLDTLQFMSQKNEELVELKRRLLKADADHAKLLEKLRSMPQPPLEAPDANLRIIDFVWGLLSSIERDFTLTPDLQLVATELYRLSAVKKTVER